MSKITTIEQAIQAGMEAGMSGIPLYDLDGEANKRNIPKHLQAHWIQGVEEAAMTMADGEMM